MHWHACNKMCVKISICLNQFSASVLLCGDEPSLCEYFSVHIFFSQMTDKYYLFQKGMIWSWRVFCCCFHVCHSSLHLLISHKFIRRVNEEADHLEFCARIGNMSLRLWFCEKNPKFHNKHATTAQRQNRGMNYWKMAQFVLLFMKCVEEIH